MKTKIVASKRGNEHTDDDLYPTFRFTLVKPTPNLAYRPEQFPIYPLDVLNRTPIQHEEKKSWWSTWIEKTLKAMKNWRDG